MKMYWRSFTGLLVWAALSSSAQAHIKLLKPASWLTEDEVGGPQKGGPCGPGGPDDVQPMPLSMDVTTVHAGDTIMVEFEETVHHQGWFRIALDADPSKFEDIKFPNTTDCTYDMSKVPTAPHGNVLVDGLGMDEALTGPNRKFAELVKLPDAPCEKCTLQVIQVMADIVHAPPGCIYYHCAQLTILPKAGAAAGSGGSPGNAAAGGGAVAAAGTGAAGSLSGSAGASGSVAVVSPTPAAAGTAAPTPSVGMAGSAAMTTNTAPTAGMSAPAAAAQVPSNRGCAVTAAGGSSGLGALYLMLASLLMLRRKRR
jgi:MYXO-CTERM domain-containing protein